MRLSYNWLKEYVNLDGITPEELANKLTTAGLEVEGIEKMAFGTKLVIGEVMECESHPDSDHLNVTKTNVGNEVLQIVCGAPNCKKGLKVIVALNGCELNGGTIKKSTIRGVESNGMLCSLSELGVDKHSLSEYQLAGIEELPLDAPVGESDVLGYLGLDDTILDVGLTPNRADCSSMWNMAKEVGAVVNREVKWPDYENKSNVGDKTNFKVNSKTDKCPYFLGKVINNVKVKESPKWMQNYLHASGIKSINNVVDISNYVMLETGQPLHFYDLSKLPHKEITVVDDIEMKMTALDGNEYEIKKGDLLITTNNTPTGVAGIMGGEESKIDENTTSIFIEAALFNAVSIRTTSRRLNLLTEAAQRFTKGLEPLSQTKAMDRSVQLLTELADASGFEETIHCGSNDYKPLVIKETLTHCNKLLGTSFKMDEVVDVLKRLDFNPEVEGDTIISHIPSYRVDMERDADVDEEIIRMLGFEGLQGTLPLMEPTVGKLSDVQTKRRTIRTLLNGFGISEIVTYTLVNNKYIEDAIMPCGEVVKLAMPMSEERKYIRQSLMSSVLECVSYNKARSNENVNVFEISNVYAKDTVEERLAICIDGNLQKSPLHKITIPADFYTLKGIILDLMNSFGFNTSRISIKENEIDTIHFHPYASCEIYIGKDLLGIFGKVHPTFAKAFDLKETYYAELKINTIINNKASKVKFESVNIYPSIKRDIALVCKKEIKAQDLLSTITKTSKLVNNAEIFDVYEGEHVEEGYKSIAISITYQANDHTLKDDEVVEVHNTILEKLEKQTGATLRK